MKKNILLISLIGVLILVLIYFCLRLGYFIFSDYSFMDKTLASILLVAELFTLIHAVGYFGGALRVIRAEKRLLIEKEAPKLTEFPPVLIVIPAYKEPIEVLRNTLICIYNIDYPNKFPVLLDDTRYDQPWATEEKKEAYKLAMNELAEGTGASLFRRKWRGAKAGIINDFIAFLSGSKIEDCTFIPYRALSFPTMKYMVVLDADMNPFPDFLKRLAAEMEAQPEAAFIQTPQYYTNFEMNRVARVAGLQQIVFFDNICESKGTHNAMFCCGTNVMIRLSALQEVGGFDESTVTEDIATSLKLHCRGWKSLYFNKVGAFGMGPEDLGAYFKQQFRWSLGTIALLGPLMARLFLSFRTLSFGIWWEYFLAASHYLIGWIFFIMYLFPVLYIFFRVPSYFIDTHIYLTFFVPYLIFSMSLFYWTMRISNMRRADIFSTMVINAVTFPVYMKAALYALFHSKSSFTVTPKTKGESLPLTDFWLQCLLMVVAVAAIVWGLHRLYYEREPFWGILINTIWVTINLFMMSFLFYFNNPEVEEVVR